MLEKFEFNLSLIRHGESAVNATPDIMGQTADVPLTDKGRNQAWLLNQSWVRLGEEFDFIYSSPYTRALDTAEIATDIIIDNTIDHTIILSPELREYDAGSWIGKSRSETLDVKMKYKMNALNHSFLFPSGESQNMVERRVAEWLEKNILYNKLFHKLYNKSKTPINIAMFSHGMTIKCLLHYILGFDKSFTWKISIDNTSVSKLSFGEDGWRLNSINDSSHLR